MLILFEVLFYLNCEVKPKVLRDHCSFERSAAKESLEQFRHERFLIHSSNVIRGV